MFKKIAIIALLAALALPSLTQAATVDASLIPDGTYTVKVLKVVDSSHVSVVMETGVSTTLSAGRADVDFSKVQASDQLKLSLSKGAVLVFLDLSRH